MVASILNLKSLLVAVVVLASANAVDAQQKASIDFCKSLTKG